MGLFFRKDDKKREGSGGGRSFAKSYDKEKTKPAIRCSICTGEQVAGFLNKRSGQFEEIALIRSPKDLEDFTLHIPFLKRSKLCALFNIVMLQCLKQTRHIRLLHILEMLHHEA